jgi:hypothetical protein
LNQEGSSDRYSNTYNVPNTNGTCYVNFLASDSLGNLNKNIKTNFTVEDITNPEFDGNINVNSIKKDSATVVWETTEETNYKILYGTTLDLGLQINSTSFSLSHSAKLTDLQSSTSYYFKVISCDHAENCIRSDKGVFQTLSPDSNPGDQNPQNFWTSTINYDDKNFNEKPPYLGELPPRTKLQIKIANRTHSIGIVSLTSSQAVINVSSNPQQAIFNIKDSNKFDLNNDNYYDLLILLNDIKNNKANLTITYLHEQISSSQNNSLNQTNGNQTNHSAFFNWLTSADKNKNATLIISGVVLLLVILMIGLIVYWKKHPESVKEQSFVFSQPEKNQTIPKKK